jgi:hypothetical protein
MPFIDNLIGVGMQPEVAAVLNKLEVDSSPGYNISTAALTATGTTIADALQITTFYANVQTTALNTGVKLPSAWPKGQMGIVYNGGANPLNLYPPSASFTLLGKSAGAAVTLAAATPGLVLRTGDTSFAVYRLTIED